MTSIPFTRCVLRAVWTWAAVLIAAVAMAAPAIAQEMEEALLARLTPAAIQQAFPGAEQVMVALGRPSALQVLISGEVAGYLFSTLDVVNQTGYAGKPFDIVAGVTPDGDITGATILEHHETIVGRGVPQELLDSYVAGFVAATLDDFRAIRPDVLNRATVSARIMKRGIKNAADVVFAGHVLGEFNQPVTEPTLNRHDFRRYSFEELLAGGSVTNVTITNKEIIDEFADQVDRDARPEAPTPGRDATFLNMYVALITPASIGSNLFGDSGYASYLSTASDEGLVVWIAGQGGFSWMGSSYLHSESEYRFNRVKLVQGDLEIPLYKDNFKRVLQNSRIPVPSLSEQAAFVLPADSGLDPLLPWRVEVTVPGTAADGSAAAVTIPVTYQLPERHMLLPPPEPVPAWVEAWLYETVNLSILAALLVAATALFIFQDALTRWRRTYQYVRIGFLAFTLGWLGFYAGGQLSIINLAAYLQAPLTGTGLSTFLLDPVVFVLAVYVGISLILIGRGVFCGWLCPFGALQELLNKAGRLLRIPQIHTSQILQERLWVVKYLAAIAVIGVAFASPALVNTVSEVEPFKTAITVKFMREWPYVLFAVALLAAGLFVERFYCRFLCPLGASLAVIGRVHMFNWLKRRPACGTECRICESECPIGAIDPTGQINLNECLQCLDCQVAYHDDHMCPPLIQRRKRKASRQAAQRPGAVPAGPLIPEAIPAE